jgi:hypothetical protein
MATHSLILLRHRDRAATTRTRGLDYKNHVGKVTNHCGFVRQEVGVLARGRFDALSIEQPDYSNERQFLARPIIFSNACSLTRLFGSYS